MTAVRIAVVSDTHLTPRAPAFADNWTAARAWIDTVAPDLAVHLGDITADGEHDPLELEAARALFDGVGPSMRFLPGNHDIGDNPIAPGVVPEHPVDPLRLADYRRVFGPDRWSVRAGVWQIIGLNAQLLGTDGEEEEAQFRWLDDELARGTGPVVLMLHKPLFRNGPGDAEAHGRYVPSAPRRRLLVALAARELRLVLSGHVHQSRRLAVGPVEHVWVPSTACCLPDAIQERLGDKVVGVALLELDDRSHRVECLTPPGVVRHNILDQPQIYPKYAELRATLGDRAALP